jgi:putative transposase
MPLSNKPSFVMELPLKVDSKQDSELQARFNAAMRLYNNVLGEARTRMELLRNSEAYQTAKGISRDNKKERSEAFSKPREQARFSDYDLQAYANRAAKDSKWIAQKIDAQVQQKLATRAFKAVERVLFGKAKDVRFKVESRFRSVEGKTNKQGIKWQNNHVVWTGLKLPAIIEPDNEVIKHGKAHPIKYCRIIRRILNGKRRWFVQLVLEGVPYQKPQNYVSDGLIGLDLNISNIAFVGNKKAGLLPFAEGVPTFEQEISTLQRKMQRSQRASNPDNYEPNYEAQVGRKTVVKQGKVKKGKRQWKKSANYRKHAFKKCELERRKTAYAKSCNRAVVNEILRHGKHIKTENISLKGWQKRYGFAISAKSPGFVQSELARKAVSAGGQFIKFSTQKTALSQTHLTGERVKKSLSQRVHYDHTGVTMHRDLFSAYLSRFVNDEDNLLLHLALHEWERSESILMEAWKEFQTNCERVSASESRMSHSPSEQFSNKLEPVNQIVSKDEKLTCFSSQNARNSIAGCGSKTPPISDAKTRKSTAISAISGTIAKLNPKR